jgi:hypothetical protein
VAALLFLIGAAAVGANIYFARPAAADLSTWRAPIDQVDSKKIVPANALASLAGVFDSVAMQDDLNQGDLESAFALNSYGPDFLDPARAGTFLLLGSRYASAKQSAKAVWCYQYAAVLSTISPMPSDLTRVQTLLEAAQGLRSLGAESAARDALDQAYLIAQYSFSLQRETRARLLSQVANAYQSFGLNQLAAQARQKSTETANQTSDQVELATRTPFRVRPAELPADQDLKQRIEARVTAARELIDQLNLNPPKTPKDLPDDLIRTLGDKLYDEDGVRSDYYEAQYKAAADASAQIAILRDRIRWLTLKLRLARGGFGLSIVPEWESQVKQIEADLSEAYDTLFQINEHQASAADKPEDADRQVEDVLRTAILTGRLGLYRNYDEADLRSRLAEISQHLRDEQVPALRLDSFARGNQAFYLLVPDELYEQGDKAMPR